MCSTEATIALALESRPVRRRYMMSSTVKIWYIRQRISRSAAAVSESDAPLSRISMARSTRMPSPSEAPSVSMSWISRPGNSSRKSPAASLAEPNEPLMPDDIPTKRMSFPAASRGRAAAMNLPGFTSDVVTTVPLRIAP